MGGTHWGSILGSKKIEENPASGGVPAQAPKGLGPRPQPTRPPWHACDHRHAPEQPGPTKSMSLAKSSPHGTTGCASGCPATAGRTGAGAAGGNHCGSLRRTPVGVHRTEGQRKSPRPPLGPSQLHTDPATGFRWAHPSPGLRPLGSGAVSAPSCSGSGSSCTPAGSKKDPSRRGWGEGGGPVAGGDPPNGGGAPLRSSPPWVHLVTPRGDTFSRAQNQPPAHIF